MESSHQEGKIMKVQPDLFNFWHFLYRFLRGRVNCRVGVLFSSLRVAVPTHPSRFPRVGVGWVRLHVGYLFSHKDSKLRVKQDKCYLVYVLYLFLKQNRGCSRAINITSKLKRRALVSVLKKSGAQYTTTNLQTMIWAENQQSWPKR